MTGIKPFVEKSDAQMFVDFLNHVFKQDPQWIETLVSFRPSCNARIAGHPTIQVGGKKGKAFAGVLGLLNGFFSDKEYIAASYDIETRELIGFQVLKRK